MFICQMSGMPGTGKSTLARCICKAKNAVLLDLDVIRTSVMDSAGTAIDINLVGKIAYNMAFVLADSNLGMGNSVVIDSPCRFDFILDRGTSLAKKYDIPYKFIECYLDINNFDELNRRRVEREILLSQKVNIPISKEDFLRGLETFKRPIEYEYLIIDTIRGIDDYIERIIKYLETV